jgi:phosphatidylglycerophosphate synthase
LASLIDAGSGGGKDWRVLAQVRDIYRQSRKTRDNFWTEWISRPPAAVLVWLLQGTRVTPNQVSFVAIFVAAAGAALLIAWRTHLGLVAAGLTLQLAYVIDCVDGQLARIKHQASPVGALLDFMLDEVKAFLVLSAAAVRLYLERADDRFLLLGLGGLVACATGITLTTFMRRPEYLEATGAPPLAPATERGGHAPRSLSPVALVEALGRYVLHYPSWFLFVCAANRLEIFLYAYVAGHVLYLGRASLVILLKLGRPARST